LFLLICCIFTKESLNPIIDLFFQARQLKKRFRKTTFQVFNRNSKIKVVLNEVGHLLVTKQEEVAGPKNVIHTL
jgi:hypothetical protein